MALTVLIAGGGTGGHLFPGLAVARELQRQRPGARVSFVGTATGLEARVVPAEGFELDVIRSAGIKGKSLRARFRGAALLPLSLLDAWRVLARRRPDVVVGVGGYSSGPVVLLAAWRGVPTMVLEQNARPGLTNRLLARWVRAAAVTFDESLAWFAGRGFVSGNPVRQEFFEPVPTGARSGAARRKVLILGGSQGAHALNVAMPVVAAELAGKGLRPDLVHQTGVRDLAAVRKHYGEAGIDAIVEPFLDRVAEQMKTADLVVCRAGATTLAELAASGRPAVLVPFPAATDDHQRRNAVLLAEAGAAVVVEERELGGSRLADVVSGLLADPARLETMQQAMRRFARPDAAARIVDRVLELATPSSPAAVSGVTP